MPPVDEYLGHRRPPPGAGDHFLAPRPVRARDRTPRNRPLSNRAAVWRESRTRKEDRYRFRFRPFRPLFAEACLFRDIPSHSTHSSYAPDAAESISPRQPKKGQSARDGPAEAFRRCRPSAIPGERSRRPPSLRRPRLSPGPRRPGAPSSASTIPVGVAVTAPLPVGRTAAGAPCPLRTTSSAGPLSSTGTAQPEDPARPPDGPPGPRRRRPRRSS